MLKKTALIALIALVLPTAANASLKDLRSDDLQGFGAIQFQLRGPEGYEDVTGHWTLIRPGNERTEGDDKDFSFDELIAGMYTFTTDLPEGTAAEIEILLNGKNIDTIATPQVSIPLDGQDRFFIKVTYRYEHTGTVAVNSSPSGLSFTVKGPNNSEFKGVTPYSLQDVPRGQYAAYFDEIEGCPIIPPQSDRLEKDSRITLSVEVVCENLKDTDAGKNAEKALEFVTVTIEGKTVSFEDVRTADWFAPYVYTVAKAAIVSGYKDRSGNPDGKFGPSDNVTIAQLSKVAHELSGIDETKVRVRVLNTRAKNQWFENYFASAEQLWWEVWRDRRVDPSRPAKRGEVIGTILRALNVRTLWAEGRTFGDVLPTHKFANAIETAAADGLIDAGGNFRPEDPINRAEIAKIVANAIDLYIEDTHEVQAGSR